MFSMLYIVRGTEARTLPARYIGQHKNGWRIVGKIKKGIYVNEFEAVKGNKRVYGDFEHIVYATSYKTLQEFLALFPFVEWDYGDLLISYNKNNKHPETGAKSKPE